MKQSRGKTEIRMFSNGRARILGSGSNNKMHNFWVRVFSDFYKDYEESLRLKTPRKNYFSKYEKVADRLNITEAGSQKLDRAWKRAQAVFRRMGRLLERSLIPFKNLQVFDATGGPQKSLMAIIAYVRSAYETIYDMVQRNGVPDPHPVAFAAAKVACNFIITIKTAVIIASLSDEEAAAASKEAGLDQIDEGGAVEGEESLPPNLSKQLSSLIAKYRAAYKMLGITSVIPTVTQQIRRIVLATLATQYPQLGIPDSVYSLGSFAYNEMIGKLVEHILHDKIEAYQKAGAQIGQSPQQGTVAQSKKPQASTLTNEPQEDYIADDLDEEDAIFEGVEDEDFEEDDEESDVMALSPVKDEEEYDETDSEFIEPQYIDDDDYDDDDDDDDDDYDDDYDYDDDDDDDDEVSETRLEQAIADIQVSPQSKRLARKFAAQNPEGFEDYDELKRKLYSFLIKNLFRYRYFSDEKAEDEAKEHIADIIDRLESIEEKIGSLEEAVEKVVEASTAVVENTEDSEEEDEKFDLFLEKSKEEEEEKEEEESDSQEESEEEVDSEEGESEEDEEKDKEEESEGEEEKSQSKRSNRYSEIKKQKKYKDISEKKKVGKKLFSYEEMEEMDEMEEMKSKRAKRYSGDTIEAKSKKEEDAVKKFRRIFSDEEDREQEKRYEEFFSKKLRQKRLKSKLASDKDAYYGRKSKKHKDIDVVSIIHKLQKPKRRSPRR